MAINTQTNPAALNAGVQLYTTKFIEELARRIAPLVGFSRNFTDDFNTPGDKLEVPFLEAGTSAEFNESSNNFETATTDGLKSATIALGAHPIIKFTVTAEMVAKFLPVHWEEKARMNAHELAADIFDAIAGVAVSSKATQSAELPVTISVPDIVELAKQADLKNINPRLATLYLTPTDYYDLLKSMEYRVTGTTTLAQGDLGGVDVGFREIVCLPATATTSFIGLPDFVMLASKPYLGAYVGNGGTIISEQILRDANTGLAVVQTVVRSGATKALIHNLDCWYGCEIGNPKAGIKVTRASGV